MDPGQRFQTPRRCKVSLQNVAPEDSAIHFFFSFPPFAPKTDSDPDASEHVGKGEGLSSQKPENRSQCLFPAERKNEGQSLQGLRFGERLYTSRWLKSLSRVHTMASNFRAVARMTLSANGSFSSCPRVAERGAKSASRSTTVPLISGKNSTGGCRERRLRFFRGGKGRW